MECIRDSFTLHGPYNGECQKRQTFCIDHTPQKCCRCVQLVLRRKRSLWNELALYQNLIRVRNCGRVPNRRRKKPPYMRSLRSESLLEVPADSNLRRSFVVADLVLAGIFLPSAWFLAVIQLSTVQWGRCVAGVLWGRSRLGLQTPVALSCPGLKEEQHCNWRSGMKGACADVIPPEQHWRVNGLAVSWALCMHASRKARHLRRSKDPERCG